LWNAGFNEWLCRASWAKKKKCSTSSKLSVSTTYQFVQAPSNLNVFHDFWGHKESKIENLVGHPTETIHKKCLRRYFKIKLKHQHLLLIRRSKMSYIILCSA
jgi:hypothetical protein